MIVLYVVNSHVGKPGNIGFRVFKLVKTIKEKPYAPYLVARRHVKGRFFKTIDMKWFGSIGRILNAVNIYVSRNFEHRKYDILFFRIFFSIASNLGWLKSIRKTDTPKLAHVIEYSPETILKLKKDCFSIILDVPIAPAKYVEQLELKYGETFGMKVNRYMFERELASLKLADLIVVPSDFVFEEVVKLGIEPGKCRIVPFGADISTDNYEKPVKTHVDFVFAGAVSYRKGIEFLLEAWSHDRFKCHKLHLCGRIDPRISKLLKKYNFKNVLTPGFVDTKEYFRNCDVYVFPSLLEGSSKSIYEAMAAGLPVITTFESGSVIEHGVNGLIVQKCESSSLRKAMQFYLDDRDKLLMHGKNSKNIASKYTWERYAAGIYGLYKEVVKGG